MKNNSSSEPPLLTRFFYQTICTRCAPEDIRINQAIDQQLATDLLYIYDPTQIEVGKENIINSFIIS